MLTQVFSDPGGSDPFCKFLQESEKSMLRFKTNCMKTLNRPYCPMLPESRSVAQQGKPRRQTD